jgi:hypothetical protein
MTLRALGGQFSPFLWNMTKSYQKRGGKSTEFRLSATNRCFVITNNEIRSLPRTRVRNRKGGISRPREAIRSGSANAGTRSALFSTNNHIDTPHPLIYKSPEKSVRGWKSMRKSFASLKAQRLLLIIAKGYLI